MNHEETTLEKTIEPLITELGLRRNDAAGKLEESLLDARMALVEHPVYLDLRTPDALRTFLEYHAFAVWDFMSLLRALQQRICGNAVPWLPPENLLAARMVNEMMLVEETDELPDGSGYSSHFELYQRGLVEGGVRNDKIGTFTRALRAGRSVDQAFDEAAVPRAARDFVGATLDKCNDPGTHKLAAYFVFGRENIIPAMFRRIIENLEVQYGASFPTLRYYLDRHVGIDETEHGPASRRMLSALCGDDPQLWAEAQESAQQALASRLQLWDAVHTAIVSGHN